MKHKAKILEAKNSRLKIKGQGVRSCNITAEKKALRDSRAEDWEKTRG
jgi:hypothetical protein